MSLILSCVIDRDPRFLMQAWTLLLSLQDAGVRPDADTRIVVHAAGQDPADPRFDVLRALGAEIAHIAPFGDGPAAWSNKLRQLENPDLLAADRVILCDADLLMLADPRGFFDAAPVRARIVDGPNPPEPILRALWDAAGMALPDLVPMPFFPDDRTHPANCNGGLYLFQHGAAATLAEPWARWTRFCLDRAALLDRWAMHADQLGFALAMQETGLALSPLASGQNLPTHRDPASYALIAPVEPQVLHYHGHVAADGMPAPTRVAWIDRALVPAVARLRSLRRGGFDNRAFWDNRYATNPELGSGLGSRGEVLATKQALLAPVLAGYRDRPVVDIGCGDLETLRGFDLSDVTGIDGSAAALEIARGKRPDWRFVHGDAAAAQPGMADLAICLDVAIHQPDAASYRALIDGVVAASRDAVLVSGYERPPEGEGIVFFHDKLSQTLAAHPDIARVNHLGSWRDVDLFLAERRPAAGRNPSDIGAAGLAWGMAHCPTPRLLAELVTLSRRQLGFFPQTIIRTLEYPWMATRMRGFAGRRVLDVGAGVSVMPLWLAEQGAQVVTCDPHDMIRDPAHRSGWNEWGFLDYAALDPRIASLNLPVEAVEDQEGFDAIYSVSVVEHIPAAARRAALARIARLLRPGGTLLLTVDVVPGSDDLWPLAEGRAVDPDAAHGTTADLRAEIEAQGLRLVEITERRAIPGSRTDLWMAAATR